MSFCPVPWNFQAIQNNGCIRVCCQMNSTDERGTIFKEDGTPYNARIDNLNEVRNAQFIKDVRKTMLNGKWHKSCQRCQSEEESGLSSRRQYEQCNWPKHTLQWAESITQKDGTLDLNKSPLVYYDLRFGNLCNLACRMCGPEDSHTWYKDHVALEGPEFPDTHGVVKLEKNEKGRWITDHYDWHKSYKFWEQLESNLINIQHVYMAGGEPLMIERHYEFLEKCINENVANNIILEYNTNLTNVPQRALDMWVHFKEVRIGASIDGYGKVLEYQRYPAKWSAIEKNLRRIDTLPNNITAWIACTVTTANVFHLPDFMLWKLEQNFKKINSSKEKPIIGYHVAHRPWPSCLRVLPNEIKKQVVDHYEQKKIKFKKYDDHIVKEADKILNGVVKYMNAKNEDTHRKWFIQFTRDLDKLRNQDITKIVPQYTDLFKGTGKY